MTKALTILEACGLIGIQYPVTATELNRAALRIHQELANTPLRVNVSTEDWWKEAVKNGRLDLLQRAREAGKLRA